MEEEKLRRNNYKKYSKLEQSIIISSEEKEPLSKDDVDKILPTYTSLSNNISSIMESLRPTIELASKSAYQMSEEISPLQEIVESLMKSLKPIINQITSSIPDMTSYFDELSKKIEELQKIQIVFLIGLSFLKL